MARQKTKIRDAVGGIRDDIVHLAGQVGNPVRDEARAQIGRITESSNRIISEASKKGREATAAVRDMTADFSEAAEETIQTHPFAVLAVAAGLGFVLGVAWRRHDQR
jgi:ElaB/YqjD/DUF883 family membrane-anchored ribosome-binding protein